MGGPASERMLGEFALRAKIGEGGFGSVYHAEQVTLGREAAVKVLHGRRSEERVRQRFLREAQIACRLDHPYAAHVYAFGAEDDGTLWIAMEYVRGTTLAQLLRRGPLPLDRFVPLFDRLAEVVETAHEQGIVHRDIKPANVMVIERAGRLIPKLLDLGIARLAQSDDPAPVPAPVPVPVPISDLSDTTLDLRRETPRVTPAATPSTPSSPNLLATEQGVAMGSPPYMAPEQWDDSHAVDERADVYALGVCAFEALTGHLPFDAKTVGEMEHAHRTLAPPSLGGSLPPALDGVLARALAKRAADRWPGALALAAALREAAGMGEIAAPLPALDEGIREWLAASAPQPIAETAQALDASRNPHELGSAVRALARVLTRTVALLALASRTRVGRPISATDSDEARGLLGQLRRRDLVDGEWIALARELLRGFAERPETHPMPELVQLFFGGGASPDLLGAGRDGPAGAEELAALGRACDLVRFLDRYPWVVAGERWTGVRRAVRREFPVAGDAPPGEVVVCDLAGRPVLSLSPLVQARPPSPGAPLELFCFVGPGRRGAKLATFPQGFTREDEDVWDWIGSRVFESDEAPAAGAEERCPFPGLAPFTRDDAARFLGREAEIDAFVNRLRTEELLAVVGPSGAGKSSFVHAGVLAALPTGWRAAVCRPGPRPLAALAALPADAEVVVVDQLEELFTLGASVADRERFAGELAVRGARVVLTLRDDFLMRAEKLPGLGPLLARGLVLVGTPPARELRRILTESLARVGYGFDDDTLADEMVASVDGVAGALPLLSFTAAELWALRDRHFRKLTRRGYESLGGVGGALARHAEATLAGLPEPARRLVREAFRHLVTAEGTRAVHTRRELEDLLGGGAAGQLIEVLVGARLLTTSEGADGDRIEVAHEALLAAWPRLVDWRREDREGARLRDQLRAASRQWEERGRPTGLLWRGDALAELRLWRARHPGPLTAGEGDFAAASERDAARGRRVRRSLVVIALALLSAATVVLTLSQRKAKRASSVAEARLVDLFFEQGRLAHLAGDDDKALVYLWEAARRGAEGDGLALLLGRTSRSVEREERELAGHTSEVRGFEWAPGGERIVSAGDDGAAIVWDWRSGRRLATLKGPGRTHRAAFTPDGKRVVTASFDGRLRLYDAGDGRSLAEAEVEFEWPFVFAVTPDGAAVLSGGRDGTLRVHPISAIGESKSIGGHEGNVWSLCFAPDGTRFVSTGSDGLGIVWDWPGAREQVRLVGHEGVVKDCAFSADGKVLATAGHDRTARLWDPATGRAIATCGGHADRVRTVRFSPDGKRLVTASDDRTAKVWSVPDCLLQLSLAEHAAGVWSAEFSPDGTRAVTAGVDGVAIVWSLATGLPMARLQGHRSLVYAARFSADGDHVVTASADRTLRVWRAIVQEPALSLQLSPGSRAAFDDQGGLIAVEPKGSILRFDAQGRRIAGDAAVEGFVVDLEAGGRFVATSAPEGITVYDVARGSSARVRAEGRCARTAPDGREVAVCDPELPRVQLLPLAPGGAGRTLEWPRGTAEDIVWTRGALAVVGEAGLTYWDLSRDAPPLVLPFEAAMSGAFSGDGHWLAAGGRGRSARVWKLDAPLRPLDLVGHDNYVTSVAFVTGRGLLVTGSFDETTRIWSLASGLELARLHDQLARVRHVAVDRSGRRALSVGEDGGVLVYDLTIETRPPDVLWREAVCRVPWRLLAPHTHLTPQRADCAQPP